MKAKMVLWVCVMCLAVNGFAQHKFNVQNGTKTEFYTNLEEAVTKAAAGDTIYLPGVTVTLENDLVIDKKLALIGTGWDVDSVGGVVPTRLLNKNINFRDGSDGSLITGCELTGIQLGHRNEANEILQNISNITILRNKVINSTVLGQTRDNNGVNKIFIKENTMQYLNGHSATACFIENNCIYGDAQDFISSYFSNNLIALTGRLASCIIENNFIINNPYFSGSENCTFNNNAFTGNFTFPNETNIGQNNLINQETVNTFVVNDLRYPKNLELKENSPCIGAGTDGTDIGIYGGGIPYKKGAKPMNPHIDKLTISKSIDSEDKIKVNIQVSAQSR